MIEIASIRQAGSKDFDEVWAIVRSLKYNPGFMEQVAVLSPSWSLFKTYLALKKTGRWNRKSFEDIYRPAFIRQIEFDIEAQIKLDELVKKHEAGKRIQLVCFCEDVTLCHRSIISEMLNKRGISHKLS